MSCATSACATTEDNAGSGGNAASSSDGGLGGASGSGAGSGATAAGGSGGATGGSGGATGGSAGAVGGSAGVGASGGSSGSGATGGSPSGGTGGAASCPSGKGPSMVLVGAQCVDSTEVTNAQYALFVAAKVPPQSVSQTPSVCAWNTTFTPSQGWPATGKDAHPVVYVDWCDAYAFCAWAGKRLCGAVGGGSLPYGDYADVNKSQWLYACSGQGTKKYPYGDVYDGAACNGVDNGAGDAVAVKSLSKCEGGVPGLFDMSGNVWEWEDSCQASAGAKDQCRLRGGSFWFNGSADLLCANGNANDRSASNDIYGFRCCAP